MGRPSKYDQTVHCQQAFEMCQAGATDSEVWSAFGIDETTLYRWKHAHPEFAQAMKLGKELPNERAVATYVRLAFGYKRTVIKIVVVDGAPCSVPYIEEVPPDRVALQHFIANRMKGEWQFKETTQLEGPDGGPIRTVNATLVAEVKITPERAAADYLKIVKGQEPQT